MTRIALPLARGRFRALAFGDPAAPPLLWLHGFPDHPPTAESFLAILARNRYVVAPWLRGYAPSPVEGPYDLDTLAADVTAIIDHVGRGEPIDVVGHDWGAVITYAVCTFAPERVRRAVTLAVPHPLTFLRMLATPRQLTRSWYIAFFQLPFAKQIAGAMDLALIDRLWRGWSRRFQLDSGRREELRACLAASWPAPLEYYRAMLRWAPKGVRRYQGKTITTPLLQLHGSEDGSVAPPSARDAHRFAHRELAIVQGAGHFLHLEQPASIAGRVMGWLGA